MDSVERRKVVAEMISKKLQIMRAITTHLEGITPEWKGDCPFDLHNKVYRGRLEFGEEVVEPFIAILEAPRQINPDGGGVTGLILKEDWTLLIQGFAADDKRHPTDPAYELLGWVQKRMAMITQTKPNGGRGGLYPDEWRLGGIITDIAYQIPIVRPGRDDVSGTAYFYMPISVGVVTDISQPFVQED